MRFSMSDVNAPIPRHKVARVFRSLREAGLSERSDGPGSRTFSGEIKPGQYVRVRFRRRGGRWYVEGMKADAPNLPGKAIWRFD